MSRKFADGDRVIISQTPVDGSDKKYSGRHGTVESFAHSNGALEVYRVMLDGDDYSHAFYDADLLPYGEVDSLRAELAQAEAQVVRLKEAIRLKERNAAELPVATVIFLKESDGHVVITKQAEDSWLHIYQNHAGRSETKVLPDIRVSQIIHSNADAVIRKP